MMPANPKPPTYQEAIEEVLSHSNQPLRVDDLVTEVLRYRQSTAKDPRKNILKNLPYSEGVSFVWLDKERVLPIRFAYNGARFRIRLDREMVNEAALSLDWFVHFLGPGLSVEQISFLDGDGQALNISWQTKKRTVQYIWGKEEEAAHLISLRDWFRSQRIYHKDHILVTVHNWEKGIFRLEREPSSEIQPDLLKARNQQMADSLYDMLENARYEDLRLQVAIPTAYSRLEDKSGYPPDHFLYLVELDDRISTDGIHIRYSDARESFFDLIIEEPTRGKKSPQVKNFSKAQGEQVFRFRVQFKYKKGLWRDVEIRGKQTLSEFDQILRTAFGHDSSDHLSGFWKLVARKGEKRARYREVDLGTINPFEGGDAAGIEIASLGLEVGDRMKYVYDFGDWIEHIVVLKSVAAPEEGVAYPRVAAQNKPRYKYCVECQERGEKTVAVWLCIDCSQDLQQRIGLCDACLDAHEDHYTAEILY